MLTEFSCGLADGLPTRRGFLGNGWYWPGGMNTAEVREPKEYHGPVSEGPDSQEGPSRVRHLGKVPVLKWRKYQRHGVKELASSKKRHL